MDAITYNLNPMLVQLISVYKRGPWGQCVICYKSVAGKQPISLCWISLRNIHMHSLFPSYFFILYLNVTNTWNPSGKKICLNCAVNTLANCHLALQGGGSSASTILTHLFSRNVPVSAPEGFGYESDRIFFQRSQYDGDQLAKLMN